MASFCIRTTSLGIFSFIWWTENLIFKYSCFNCCSLLEGRWDGIRDMRSNPSKGKIYLLIVIPTRRRGGIRLLLRSHSAEQPHFFWAKHVYATASCSSLLCLTRSKQTTTPAIHIFQWLQQSWTIHILKTKFPFFILCVVYRQLLKRYILSNGFSL